jgi:hypothetical protein
MTFKRTLAALVIAGALLAPFTASAAIVNEPDESPKWLTTGLTATFWFPGSDNDNFTRVYDGGAKTIWKLHFGIVPIARYVQLEFGFNIGFAQNAGHQVGVSSDESSGENVMMTLTPLQWGFRLGIDPMEEWPVVPFGLIGWDYILWKEHTSTEELSGGKGAWHYGFGLAFLLDRLEPLRAGRNDASGGLNDAFFVVEMTKIDYLPDWQSDSALDLTGWQLSVGLKLDF